MLDYMNQCCDRMLIFSGRFWWESRRRAWADDGAAEAWSARGSRETRTFSPKRGAWLKEHMEHLVEDNMVYRNNQLVGVRKHRNGQPEKGRSFHASIGSSCGLFHGQTGCVADGKCRERGQIVHSCNGILFAEIVEMAFANALSFRNLNIVHERHVRRTVYAEEGTVRCTACDSIL